MLKLTLILLVLFIVSFIITWVMACNLDDKEKWRIKYLDEYPKRLMSMGFVLLLFFIGIVVSLIITIVTW
jgi:RsiW-degrading membrane proteinase PrsW (M82 family)